MKKQLSKTTLVATLSILISFALVPQAAADDTPEQTTVVTNNGAESNNNVTATKSDTTQVSSNNNATVHNDVHTTSDTGNNSASFNTGGSQKIITGNANTATEIKNTANTSVVSSNGCNCENSSSSTTVTGNGAGSQNTVTNSNTSQTNVAITNNAQITNNVSVNANTGNNNADFNTGGNTIIKTGDVNVYNNIDNGPINTAKVKVQGGNTVLSSFLKIAGNGAFSENNVSENNNNKTNIHVDNIADILNNVHVNANTGNNSAEFNVGGNTIIVTGNVDVATLINNVANFSLVEVVCGCEKKPTPEKPLTPGEQIPSQPSAPAPPTTSVGGPSTPSSSGPGGPSASAPMSTTLPVTGNNLLFFFLLANIVMFFLGTYLRLRSGRSPGYPVAL
jgi:hypothetical protein